MICLVLSKLDEWALRWPAFPAFDSVWLWVGWEMLISRDCLLLPGESPVLLPSFALA